MAIGPGVLLSVGTVVAAGGVWLQLVGGCVGLQSSKRTSGAGQPASGFEDSPQLLLQRRLRSARLHADRRKPGLRQTPWPTEFLLLLPPRPVQQRLVRPR